MSRLIITCFSNAQTIFDVRADQTQSSHATAPSSIFNQMAGYRNKDDSLKAIVGEAHAKNIPVYAYLDCLHWEKAGAVTEDNIFLVHPDLAEKNLVGNCGLPADGQYASPFNDAVKAALIDLIKVMNERYPDLDGVVLQNRLALGTVLGYSDAARSSYIESAGIDPIDIRLYGSQADLKIANQWVKWRMKQMEEFTGSLSKAFKAGNPSKKVAVLSYASWYGLPLGLRNTSLDDWLRWALSGSVDEVMLESRWESKANKLAFDTARNLASRSGRAFPLDAVLRASAQSGIPSSPGDGKKPGPLMWVKPEGLTNIQTAVIYMNDDSVLRQSEALWSDLGIK